MGYPFRRAFACLLLFGMARAASANSVAGSGESDLPAVHIRLGDSLVALYGPWKFSIGDSPIDPATGAPLWASPAFDDAKWETVDLTPKSAAQNPITGVSGYVPGWTARGHAGYWGYAWYRIRVQVESGTAGKLNLAGPSAVDDAYQVFDNGLMVGMFGQFSARNPGVYYARPMMFELPSPAHTPQSGSTQVIAFRMWMQPQTLFQASDVGGFESAPLLGEAAAVRSMHQVQFDELIRAYLWQPIEGTVFGLLGILALSLTLFDRSDRVYVWIGALLLLISVDAFSGTMAVWTFWVNSRYDLISHDIVLFSLQYAGWVMVWRVWFRQHHPIWIPRAVVLLVPLLMFSQTISQNLFFVVASDAVIAAAHMVSLVVRLALSAFLLYVIYRGIREQGSEGWLVLPAVLLAASAEFTQEFHIFGMRTVWFPFGVQINLAVASRLLLVIVLAVLLVRRLILSIRRQRLMALDVKQAQEVQQVILPEARTVLPHLVIESEYRPAREVGGDFFQIIPHQTDGSLLVVAGDVAGKGLKSGMLVALLVGAIRSTSDWTNDPLAILNALNQRLIGRGDAQATCLALHVSEDGKVVLANAGHVTPYLNGEPVAMEGALPLGMMEHAEFSVMRFKLEEKDSLVLTSDGIAEATDATGQLFGFERVRDLLLTSRTAAEVADTAQNFGQADDISVITLTRIAIAQTAIA